MTPRRFGPARCPIRLLSRGRCKGPKLIRRRGRRSETTKPVHVKGTLAGRSGQMGRFVEKCVCGGIWFERSARHCAHLCYFQSRSPPFGPALKTWGADEQGRTPSNGAQRTRLRRTARLDEGAPAATYASSSAGTSAGQVARFWMAGGNGERHLSTGARRRSSGRSRRGKQSQHFGSRGRSRGDGTRDLGATLFQIFILKQNTMR